MDAAAVISVSLSYLQTARTGDDITTLLSVSFGGITPDLCVDSAQQDRLRDACRSTTIRDLQTHEEVHFRLILPLPFEDTDGDKGSRDDMSSSTAWRIFYAEVVNTHSQKRQMSFGCSFGYYRKRPKPSEDA